MEPLSPPKRMTRARAAAKASGESSSSTTKPTTIASSRAKASTASSKVKTSGVTRSSSTATATTASAAAKRKLRTEDVETDNEQDELGLDRPQPPTMQKIVRAARVRTKKVVAEPEPEHEAEVTDVAAAAAPPVARGRGRPPTKKATAAEIPKEPTRPSSRASTTATTAPRATRAKKTVTIDDGEAPAAAAPGEVTEEPVKKRTTRARATSASAGTGAASGLPSATTRISVRSASATIAAKSAASKKKVTFEEPEKENIAPNLAAAKGRATAAKAAAETTTTSTGLRAKPARRAAAIGAATSTTATATAPRSRVASGKSTTDKSAAPLSPKKVTQMRMARDYDVDSEDELGAPDESNLKPFERSPTKPSLSVGKTPAERSKTLASAGLDLESSTRDITANLTTLPVPELPGGMLTSPARRPAQSPVKEGIMASPARRLDGSAPLNGVLASTVKTSSNGNNNGNNNNKASALFSPAKRFPVQSKNHAGGGSLDDTLRSAMKLSLLQTPAKRPSSPVKAAILLQRPDMKPSSLSAKAQAIASSPEPKSTLVAAKPAMGEIEEEGAEEADVSDADDDDNNESDMENHEKTESLTQMLSEMASEAAVALPESPSRRRFPGRLSAVLPRNADPTHADAPESDSEDVLSPGDPMDVDGSTMGAVAVPVAMSPPKAPSGVFGLRAKDLDVCHEDDDMDSDNDLTTSLPLLSNDDTPATPCPAKSSRSSRTPSGRSVRASTGGQSTAKRHKMGKFGFTPLADQLNGWKVRSPSKTNATPTPLQQHADGESANDTQDGPKLSPEVSDNSVMPTFFDDAMAGHSLPSSPRKREITDQTDDKDCAGLMDNVFLQEEVETPEFDDDLAVTEEDLELAQEANDMSHMEPAELEDITHVPQSSDDAMSEASQEYGDENAIPIDPALLADSGSPVAVPPVTPQRVLAREFHTVSKVPLKPADESTPQPAMRRRSMSASRLPTSSRRRSSISSVSSVGANAASPSKRSDNGRGLTRSATVISYSPTKKEGRRESRRKSRRESFGGPAATLETVVANNGVEDENQGREEEGLAVPSAPVTPTKSGMAWSTAGTPARTPRRDLDPALLRGAVVFVDVHTTEGADASAIFVELLSQMGARCVKSWSWNPSSPTNNKDGSSRVGITHVVFKDGSKRTLEKVRESNGVVQCVGVSWVLDCERGNQWLDEAPYYIDTALVPRGGARRRKSMEPQAIANINGILVSTPPKQAGTSSTSPRGCRTAPSTPMNRRDSTLWMRTPEDEESNDQRRSYGGSGEENGGVDGYGEPDWGMTALLTPVPKTPAPEVIARFAANVTPSSPYGSDAGGGVGGYYDDDDDTLNSMQFDQGALVMRTCPPKQRSTSYNELGAGILSREKDEGVLMRLMAARRKSLQFAPKIASPLSKAWN